jgi:hypothetical protein
VRWDDAQRGELDSSFRRDDEREDQVGFQLPPGSRAKSVTPKNEPRHKAGVRFEATASVLDQNVMLQLLM